MAGSVLPMERGDDHCVADLSVLLSPGAIEDKRIRKRLESCIFPDCWYPVVSVMKVISMAGIDSPGRSLAVVSRPGFIKAAGFTYAWREILIVTAFGHKRYYLLYEFSVPGSNVVGKHIASVAHFSLVGRYGIRCIC